MQRGERVRGPAPVDYVEGVGGFLLDVLGMWAFEMRNVFGQVVQVTACIVEGCTSEFLMGLDFLKEHRASMDFDANEVRYFEKEMQVVIPFRTEGSGDGETRVAPVRLARQVKLTRCAVTPVSIAVVAPEGEQGIFVPTRNCGAVMLATTVTRVSGGKALIPAINLRGERTRLPNKKELGVWIPFETDMELLELNNALEPGKVDEWIEALSDTEVPLENESEVRVGSDDDDTRRRGVKLLRAYRGVTTSKGDIPPVTTLDVQHHIDTQGAAPIMLKRRRQAQSEEAVVDDNVATMLQAGVIEKGNGASGFPVVLVRKKDGEVRFCIDY
ncbi:hypothetical protein PF010_g30906 [Phytophthora fragariae]|uniref:Reverse transcriptase domain-containing protein n=3 Tax=Phytophthora fragariae TaxID=53985 RepID=A0A6G0JJE8_9STRA|nr:hypothetical protein PF010_g30906 [Phytophthora fragariae]